MVLRIPRYPEFDKLFNYTDQALFYIPSLEMVYGEVCSAMKKCWKGFKIARGDGDVENQEYYADIIQGILRALGYPKMTFWVAEDIDDMQEAEDQEVSDIELELEKRRAEEFVKPFRRPHYDWDEITKQYVRYTSPEEEEEYLMEIQDET